MTTTAPRLREPAKLVVGTRASGLALAQAREVAARIEAAHPPLRVVLRKFRTSGDRRLDLDLRLMAGGDSPLGKGLFTRELEEALLDGRIDLAVHSLKDLPTTLPRGLTVGAVLPREDSSDVLAGVRPGGLGALPRGAVVCTGSERRRLQLLAARPDLRLDGLRGNVPTRLRKLALGEAGDAIVLAAAGLKRLGLPHEGRLDFEGSTLHLTSLADIMLPAAGQGIIGIECRARDPLVLPILKKIHDKPGGIAALAERALLRALGGGCQMPLGVTTSMDLNTGSLAMRAVLFFDPEHPLPALAAAEGSTKAPVALARDLAKRLLAANR